MKKPSITIARTKGGQQQHVQNDDTIVFSYMMDPTMIAIRKLSGGRREVSKFVNTLKIKCNEMIS